MGRHNEIKEVIQKIAKIFSSDSRGPSYGYAAIVTLAVHYSQMPMNADEDSLSLVDELKKCFNSEIEKSKPRLYEEINEFIFLLENNLRGKTE